MIASLAAVFLVGLVIGAVVFTALDDDVDPAAPTAEDCAEAMAVVDGSLVAIDEITASDATQDESYFAAILVEQRTITFVMEERPDCFTLADRAGSAGFQRGVEALLDTSAGSDVPVLVPSGAPAEPAPDSGSEGDSGGSSDSDSGDGEPATDE